MPMHAKVGDHNFIVASLNTLVQHFAVADEHARSAIAQAMGWNDEAKIEAERQNLVTQLQKARDTAAQETPMPYVHYASRFSIVGAYQAVLSKLFSDIPELQGYGDGNPIWVITPVEHAAHVVETFFSRIYEGARGQHKSLLASFVQAWKELPFDNAPYPTGLPNITTFPDECCVALLADWGGDNPAAKKVAAQVVAANPDIAIHLGDIYYGGTKWECEAFIANWPVRKDGNVARANSNFALNGNHEMYTGGKSYFEVVLPEFRQDQPFFCIENSHWRLIGLDTAYNGGRLMPNDPTDPLTAQWNWLIELLRRKDQKANILLTHHQPVSAHSQEFADSAPLRGDVKTLLEYEGVEPTAIFGWFFGHEHRCAIYDTDPRTNYLPRLIGSGCIPHIVQQEKSSDPGTTRALYFNKRSEDGAKNSAISMFANLRFIRDSLVIDYIDEDRMSWGSEIWYSTPGRIDASSGFTPADGVEMVSSHGAPND